MAYPSTVTQIQTRISNLAANPANAGICTRVELTNKTYEGGTTTSPGRTVAYLRIGTGTGGGRPRILINAGMHAREWAPPDAVLTFVEKLLAAYTAKKPMVYGKFDDKRSTPNILFKEFTISYPDVKQIVERTELYVLPLANPDGRAYSMHPSKANVGWRKNRRPAPPSTTCPPFPPTVAEKDKKFLSRDPAGVDLNRNFDIAWDLDKYYSTTGAVGVGVGIDPCTFNQTYHGPKPYDPEPETKNIQGLLKDKNINFYMDVHSAAGKFLFAWGMEQNQETDDKQTFKSADFDRKPPDPTGTGGRDGKGTAYKEWMPPGQEKAHKDLGGRMVNAILGSTGYSASDEATDPVAKEARKRSTLTTVQSTRLFSSSSDDLSTGVSRDYAFSRQIGATSGTPVRATALAPVYSYTFECGSDDDGGFWPDATKHYPKIEREVGAALASFLTFAATWVAPVPASTPTPSPPPPPSTGGGGCFDMMVMSLLAVLTAAGAAGAVVVAVLRSLGGW